MVNILVHRSIRDSLITEEQVMLPTTEEMTGTKGAGVTIVMIGRAAGMEEVTIETDVMGDEGLGAAATVVAVAEVRVLNMGDAEVVAALEIDLDAIVIPGAVLRIATQANIQALLME